MLHRTAWRSLGSYPKNLYPPMVTGLCVPNPMLHRTAWRSLGSYPKNLYPPMNTTLMQLQNSKKGGLSWLND
jgi:hypothetical protein